MTVCGQCSQRATWPPSAAVRQRSMALITFIWSRLTCPALALRHAAPWSRKMSATSSAGRDTAVSRYGDSWAFLLLLGFLRQMGGEAVAQRMERHALLDPGRGRRLVEQA